MEGQLGLERTPEEYLERMVAVFREARRVLRSDGTCWMNMGDSYASNPPGNARPDHSGPNLQGTRGGQRSTGATLVRAARAFDGLKPKDLCGIPWRLALALQADGWYLRSDIIWHKPNPMPESVTDRPTKAHEYIFLLSKSARYFYDAEAIKEPAEYGYREQPSATWDRCKVKPEKVAGATRGANPESGRNARSVWTIATQPFPGAHFATFPEVLAERCIRAGTSERGCCPECGAPWVRVVKRGGLRSTDGTSDEYRPTKASDDPMVKGRSEGWTPNHYRPSETIGWRPTCDHAGEPVPCTVGDIFGGAGTVGLVASKLKRDYILIELNPKYTEMAERRIETHKNDPLKGSKRVYNV